MEFIVKKVNENLNSDFFDQENVGKFLFMRDGNLIISGCENQEEANFLIANHNPPSPKELTISEKLQSIGLNLDDLKIALDRRTI